MTDPVRPFDRAAVRAHRDRAAASFSRHDFLFAEVAERLADRLDDMTRRFPSALDLGSHDGVLARTLRGRGGIQTLVQLDLSPAMARSARRFGPSLAADEERLPFCAAAFDAVLSCLSLHWVNDLPGALIQARRALKPDGLFLAAMLGAGTLAELRAALIAAESETSGGAAPRVSPFADLGDAAALLQRAGFALPVADSDTVTVTYPDALRLMQDLRAMGEANALHERPRGCGGRSALARTAAHYAEHSGTVQGQRIAATFRILYLTAWAPHPTQPKPLAPGSAQARLADALGATEKRLRPKD
jgi:NADH dehydrogenase [ubiquinone] 1 alpha subcomplex assembly factor 5